MDKTLHLIVAILKIIINHQGLLFLEKINKLKLKLITFGIAHHSNARHFQVHLTVRNNKMFNTHGAPVVILSASWVLVECHFIEMGLQ